MIFVSKRQPIRPNIIEDYLCTVYNFNFNGAVNPRVSDTRFSYTHYFYGTYIAPKKIQIIL
jgi:hypothetical protein